MSAPTRITRLLCGAAMALGLAGCTGGEVGGTVSGLGEGLSVTLLNNGADPLTVTRNGSFVFNDTVEANATYAVTVGTQPVGQSCSVSNGSGTIDEDGTSVENVLVSCAFAAVLRGSVSGLLAGTALTLSNGSDQLTVGANGPFAFTQTLADGTAYDLRVSVQPAVGTCVVPDGSGTFVAASFQDIAVTCN